MQYICTTDAPTPGAYSQGVLVDPQSHLTLYLAGQTARDPRTGDVVEGGLVEQTRRCLENLLAVVRAAGGDADAFIFLEVFLKAGLDPEGDRRAFDYAYRQFLDAYGVNPRSNNMPVRMQVLPPETPWEYEDALIEMRGIAAIPRRREPREHRYEL